MLGGQLPTATTVATTATSTEAPTTFNEFNKQVRRLVDEFEILNKQFLADAHYVNDYDKVLRDNQNKITLANEELVGLEKEKDKCVSETETINVLLKEVTEVVAGLEKQLGITDVDSNSAEFAKTSDVKRQNLLQMFLAADSQMQQLEEDVGTLVREIEAISKSTGKEQTGSDTFEEIQQILASQMDQLVFVDKQSEVLAKKITEIRNKL